MESNAFQYTRFKIFGLLTEGNNTGEQVCNYQSDVDNEKKLQVELDGTKSNKTTNSTTDITKTVCLFINNFDRILHSLTLI